MARRKARFRISIKDNLTGEMLKVELITVIGSQYLIRQNGVRANRMRYGNLSKICSRLRGWLVRQAKAPYRQDGKQ